jgi:hypothetical protein
MPLKKLQMGIGYERGFKVQIGKQTNDYTTFNVRLKKAFRALIFVNVLIISIK